VNTIHKTRIVTVFSKAHYYTL